MHRTDNARMCASVHALSLVRGNTTVHAHAYFMRSENVIDVLRHARERFERAIALFAFALLDVACATLTCRAEIDQRTRTSSVAESVEPVFGG